MSRKFVWLMLGVFFLLFICLSSSVYSTVYLNVQWDTTFNRFMVKPLKIVGESVTLDCQYQNAYGDSMGLTPGPPFIIEDPVIIDNVYGANMNVIDWGGLTIDAQFACGKPFTVAVVNPDANIMVNGNLLVEGSTSNPVVFQGYFNFYSQYTGGGDTSYVNSYNITLENCVFDNPDYGGPLLGRPFTFLGGNVTFDGCTFNDFSGDYPSFIEYFDDAYQYRLPYWHFTMRNCSFTNTSFDLLPPIAPVEIAYAKEVTLEHNYFGNIDFNADWGRSVVVLKGCGLRSIKQNTADNTSLNAFVFNGCSVDTNAYLQSSDGLPFIMGPFDFNIEESGALEIGDGSVLKMLYADPFDNMTVSGSLTANNTVFTSWRDDSHGGATDFGSTGSPLYWSRGIRVTPSGTISLTDCKVLYSEFGVVTQGDAFIDSCLFENNHQALSLNGFNDNIFQVSNSTFRNNTFTGLSANCDSGSIQNLSLINVSSLSNGADGLSIEFRNNHSINAAIDNCQLAGNGEYGIGVWYMSGSGSIDIINSVISANANDGIIANDYGVDDIHFNMANNVIVGNGNTIPSGFGHDAVDIGPGSINFINNTVGYSYGMGFKYYPSVVNNNDVVNNIFFNNGNYGVFKYTETTPLFAKNDFWNDGSNGDLFFRTSSKDLYSVEDVATLGGEYASNLHLDPMFTPEIIDSISRFSYDSVNRVSIIITDDTVFQNKHLEHTIIQPDTSEYPWFYILRNTNDSLFILGDIRDVADTGDVYRIFNHHLLDISPLVDAGRNASVIGYYDIDREDRVMDGDSNTIATVDIGADEYNPTGYHEGTIVIVSPKANELYLVGDTCEIKWETTKVDTVNIYYAINYDSTNINLWIPIDTNIDASQGSYQWIVPKELSAKCKIMIEKAQDTYISAQSDLFKIKWYILTRFDSTGEYEAFSVQQDGWSFPNDSADMWPDTMWQNYDYTGLDPYTNLPYPHRFITFYFAQPKNFPDWTLFVKAFNVHNCYYVNPLNPNDIKYYRLWAECRWASIKSKKWRGSCFGFANASMLAFIDKPFFETLDGIGNFNNLMDFQINTDVRALVNMYWIYQFGRQFSTIIYKKPWTPLEKTLEDCQQMLAADSALQNDRILLLLNPFWGGHAVTPYECRQDENNPALWRIYVYDNNYPADSGKFVVVDTSNNTWEYTPLNFKSDIGLELSDSLTDYYGNAIPFYYGDAGSFKMRYKPNSINDVLGFAEFYITSVDSISFASSMGTIGRYGDSSFNNLTLGQPIIPFVGQQVEPLGYILPDSSWTCQFSGFKDSVVPLRIFTDSTVMTYFNGHPNGGEKIYYPGNDSSLWIFNMGSDTNTITFEGDAVHPDSEIVTRVSGFNILSGDSTGFSITDRSGLKIENKSQTTSYDIDLFYVGNTVKYIFHNEGVIIPGGAVHLITPTINDLDSNKLKILIDNNDNGIIDDSLFVVNMPTGINDNNFTPLPKKYGLSQNYPNPFNATTTIRYEVPKKSKVLIAVYNIMGQKVATLVNKNKEAGVYTVSWDASNVASGIYFYRIKAGEFVQTKKMLLLK